MDFVYFVGDVDSHTYWVVNETTVLNISVSFWLQLEQLYKEKCPNTQIYVAWGNHDKFPLNLVPPLNYTNPATNVTTAQAYNNKAAEIWPRLAQDPSIAKTVSAGGYYVTKLRDGLKLIVLDVNGCYTFNFWLAYDPALIRPQFEWLVEELQKSECDGTKVHLLLHIPPKEPGLDKTCAAQFQRIVERYNKTIINQFAGHTHYQDVNLQYSKEHEKQLASYLINGGSV